MQQEMSDVSKYADNLFRDNTINDPVESIGKYYEDRLEAAKKQMLEIDEKIMEWEKEKPNNADKLDEINAHIEGLKAQKDKINKNIENGVLDQQQQRAIQRALRQDELNDARMVMYSESALRGVERQHIGDANRFATSMIARNY
jgi:chromosome segregation ATPase